MRGNRKQTAMTAPRREHKENRDDIARARVTAAEKQYIAEQARLAGLHESEYIRRRLLDYIVPTSASVPATDPALITELNRLGLELRRIGNNANQLAINAHTGRRGKLAWNVVVKAIHEQIDAVAAVIEKLVLKRCTLRSSTALASKGAPSTSCMTRTTKRPLTASRGRRRGISPPPAPLPRGV